LRRLKTDRSKMDKLTKITAHLESNSLYTSSEIHRIIFPLAKKIISLKKPNKTIIIGIQGGQGTGKTTLVQILKTILTKMNYSVHSFSIDNFYKNAKQRKQIAQRNHSNPFYQIARGMPGTHRVKELQETLNKIKGGKPFQIPLFDKSLNQGYGDVLKKTIRVRERPDFILFEGWCVGIPSTTSSELQKVCARNKIPLSKIDPTLKSHQTVLHNIKKYQPLWKYLDYIIMLKPDSSILHRQWRWKQEQELIKKKGKGMRQAHIAHFVNIYLPFTYLCYEKIKPNIKIIINKNHKMYQIKEPYVFS